MTRLQLTVIALLLVIAWTTLGLGIHFHDPPAAIQTVTVGTLPLKCKPGWLYFTYDPFDPDDPSIGGDLTAYICVEPDVYHRVTH